MRKRKWWRQKLISGTGSWTFQVRVFIKSWDVN
jgi:hypothetical protein